MEEKALEVLEQYDLEVIRTRKGRGVYFVETNRGLHILKEYPGSEEKLERLWQLTNALEGISFFETDVPVKNKEGNFLTKLEGQGAYLLKSLKEGRECDPKSEIDACRAMEGLAMFHTRAAGAWSFVSSEEQKKYEGTSLVEEMEKRTRELKKVQSFIRKKQKKNEFEICYLETIPYFLEHALGLSVKLTEGGYHELQQRAIARGYICHGAYHQHNVLIDRGTLVLTNFEHAHLDLPCTDIALFLRKTMEKQGWSLQAGGRILDAYEVVRPLEGEERRVLAMCLSYPEKLWKLANHYYHSNKAWGSVKDLEKLKTFVRQQKEREQFVETILL